MAHLLPHLRRMSVVMDNHDTPTIGVTRGDPVGNPPLDIGHTGRGLQSRQERLERVNPQCLRGGANNGHAMSKLSRGRGGKDSFHQFCSFRRPKSSAFPSTPTSIAGQGVEEPPALPTRAHHSHRHLPPSSPPQPPTLPPKPGEAPAGDGQLCKLHSAAAAAAKRRQEETARPTKEERKQAWPG